MRLPMKIAVGVLALAGAFSACQDLEVTNTNQPDRQRALSSPGDVEALIQTTWRNIWTVYLGSDDQYNPWPLIADEFSGTYANHGALEMSSEPRIAINNSTLAEFHTTTMRQMWETWYEVVSNTKDGLTAIEEGLEIRTADPGQALLDHTHRAKTWGTWMQGMAHAFIALTYDKGWVITLGTDVSDPFAVPLRPYAEVMDSAIVILEQAIALAGQEEWVSPASWINNTPITNQDLQRIIHSYIAHFLIMNARTPAERAAVDWDKVLFHLDNGIQQDFAPTMQSGVLTSGHLSRHQLSTSTFSTRADHYLIGPADISGRYQTWLAKPIAERDTFSILTPDNRITAPLNPTSNGRIFRYNTVEIMNPQRGLYHRSRYQWFGSQGRTSSGTWPLLSVVQMRLYRAEALFFNDDLQGAVDILNVTREAAGLEPLTVAGVPEATDCVPRLADGSCAGLYDALIYERMIELSGMNALRGYWDSRGFGRLTEGTFLSLPLPARELITIRYDGDGDGTTDVYTFGGVGGEHAAECTRVSLTCIP